MSRTRSLDTVTGPETLDQIEAALDRLWSVHDRVPSAIRMQVALAAVEIGANIIEHAAAGGPVKLQMEVTVLANEVRVDFADQGPPARVDLDTVAMPDEMAERGRGLALAKSVLDRLCYRNSGLNHWTLVSKPFGDD